jgi:hypothetical protein
MLLLLGRLAQTIEQSRAKESPESCAQHLMISIFWPQIQRFSASALHELPSMHGTCCTGVGRGDMPVFFIFHSVSRNTDL